MRGCGRGSYGQRGRGGPVIYVPMFHYYLSASYGCYAHATCGRAYRGEGPRPFRGVPHILSSPFVVVLCCCFYVIKVFSFSRPHVFYVFFFFRLRFPSYVSLLFQALVTFLYSSGVSYLVCCGVVFLAVRREGGSNFLAFRHFLFIISGRPLGRLFFASTLSFRSFCATSSFMFALLSSLSSLGLSWCTGVPTEDIPRVRYRMRSATRVVTSSNISTGYTIIITEFITDPTFYVPASVRVILFFTMFVPIDLPTPCPDECPDPL